MPRDDSVLPAFLHRFYSLSPADQLAAYEEIAEYLRAHRVEIDPDEDLRLRRASVEAIQKVAAELGLPVGRLKATSFDVECIRLDIELSSREIAEAWGGWKIARESAISGRSRETERQRELRLAQRGSYPTFESYLDGVRKWLRTKPPRSTMRAYEDWARTSNANRKPNELPVASPQMICEHLLLSWRDVLRVATGAVTLAEAKPRQVRRNRRGRFGSAHDLVGSGGVATILGAKPGRVGRLANKSEFPTPVLVISRFRLWHRGDIEAYKRGDSIPTRVYDELNDQYIGTNEIARPAGCSLAAIKIASENPRGWVPSPVLRLGTLAVFDRSAALAAVAAHLVAPRRGRRPSG